MPLKSGTSKKVFRKNIAELWRAWRGDPEKKDMSKEELRAQILATAYSKIRESAKKKHRSVPAWARKKG